MTDPARITAVTPLAPFRLHLTFHDGFAADVDLQALLTGRRGLVAELMEPSLFLQVRLDQEAGTITWPNGVDLDPDVLYDLARAPAARN